MQIVLLLLGYLLTITVSVSAASIVSNREPGPNDIGYLPADKSVVTINPPPIAWLVEPQATTYTLQVAHDETFNSLAVEHHDLTYVLYTHTGLLSPGRYYWRYRFASPREVESSSWSITRSFDVPTTAAALPRPENPAAKIPSTHPRMLLRPEDLSELRASRVKFPKEFEALISSADKSLSSPLMEEPLPWTGGKWNAKEWRGYLTQISAAGQTLDTLAFAYLLTEDQRYGKRAVEWLMRWAEWDPYGPTSVKVNDEQTMPIISVGSRAYSWVYPLLAEPQRAKFRSMMRKRAGDAFRHLRDRHYEQRAYDSHAGRMHQFVGEAGIAFYGEIPEAADWLDFAVRIFYGWYPVWGDDDGGWAEGMHYWASYDEFATLWFDQMRNILQIDPMQKPFYKNVGEFPLFAAPPGSAVNGFGDFSEREPTPARGRVAHAYSLMKQEPHWKWFAEKVGTGQPSGSLRYLRAISDNVTSSAPEPQLLKVFEKAGWACFNSDLLNADNNVQFQLRSSPYGNISHSHADQNNIVAGAFGEPLLVNTGVRDYYGSPFCHEWYWATKGHNCVLLDGMEQQRGPASKGRIAAQGKSGDFTYVAGDASNAYGTSTSLYRRWLAFDGKDTAVIVDEVETKATTMSLLFHGRANFEINAADSTFHLTRENAALRAQVIGADKITWSQTDRYTTEPSTGTTPPEWHLRADVDLGQGEYRVVATLVQIDRKPTFALVSDAKIRQNDGEITVSWVQGGSKRRLVVSHFEM